MVREHLDSVVSVRFSAAELERLRKKADEAGESVSRFVRRAALTRLAPIQTANRNAMIIGTSTTGATGPVVDQGPIQIASPYPQLLPVQ